MGSVVRGRACGIARTILVASAACALAGVGSAQTLDDQYRFLLADKCAALGFERDDMFNVVPGQAGPNLTAYCSGPSVGASVAPGVSVSTSATGGGAGAAAGRASSSGGAGSAAARAGIEIEDTALQRRQAQVRDDQRGGLSDSTIELAQSANAGAFLALDRQFERQSVTDFEDGRRWHSLATTLGADYRFGTTAAAGVALSYTKLSGDFTSGGDFDKRAQGAWMYGSWFPNDRAFIDLSAGTEDIEMSTSRLIGLSTLMESSTRTTISIDPPMRLADGRTNSRERGINLGGGYDFVLRNTTIGPRAAVAMRRTKISGFTESGETPMTLSFERQSDRSLRTALGVQASRAILLPGGPLIFQANLDWHHEYRADQRMVTARLAEDLRANAIPVRFLTQPPDRDWFDVRLSLLSVFSRRFSGFVSLGSTFGHAYLDRYSASVGVRREY